MLDGVNDSDAHARELLRAGAATVPCKFNLIPFNPFPGSPLPAFAGASGCGASPIC